MSAHCLPNSPLAPSLLVQVSRCWFFLIIFFSQGLFAGPEGPMIHIGALVGAGLSQFKSDSMGINLAYFQRFRNPEDRFPYSSTTTVVIYVFNIDETLSPPVLQREYPVLSERLLEGFSSRWKRFQVSGRIDSRGRCSSVQWSLLSLQTFSTPHF